MTVRTILSGVLVTAALGVPPIAAALGSGPDIAPAAASVAATHPCAEHAPASDGFPAQPTIGLGSRGPAVLGLQSALMFREGYPSSSLTGLFDATTRSHVLAFQREAGLVQDGIVGPKTWRALDTHPSMIGGVVVLNPGDVVRQDTAAAQLLHYIAVTNQVLHRHYRLGDDSASVRYSGDLVRMVQSFQSWAGIPSSGIIGPKTSWAVAQISRPIPLHC